CSRYRLCCGVAGSTVARSSRNRNATRLTIRLLRPTHVAPEKPKRGPQIASTPKQDLGKRLRRKMTAIAKDDHSTRSTAFPPTGPCKIKSVTSHSPPREEGWTRHQEKCREATLLERTGW